MLQWDLCTAHIIKLTCNNTHKSQQVERLQVCEQPAIFLITINRDVTFVPEKKLPLFTFLWKSFSFCKVFNTLRRGNILVASTAALLVLGRRHQAILVDITFHQSHHHRFVAMCANFHFYCNSHFLCYTDLAWCIKILVLTTIHAKQQTWNFNYYFCITKVKNIFFMFTNGISLFSMFVICCWTW